MLKSHDFAEDLLETKLGASYFYFNKKVIIT